MNITDVELGYPVISHLYSTRSRDSSRWHVQQRNEKTVPIPWSAEIEMFGTLSVGPPFIDVTSLPKAMRWFRIGVY